MTALLFPAYLLYIGVGLAMGESVRFVDRLKKRPPLSHKMHLMVCHLWPYVLWKMR